MNARHSVPRASLTSASRYVYTPPMLDETGPQSVLQCPSVTKIDHASRFEPEAVFSHPDELVAEFQLTRGQKIATVKR